MENIILWKRRADDRREQERLRAKPAGHGGVAGESEITRQLEGGGLVS